MYVAPFAFHVYVIFKRCNNPIDLPLALRLVYLYIVHADGAAEPAAMIQLYGSDVLDAASRVLSQKM